MLRSLINQRLGRYYIKELLGRGGMAAVYRATDTVLQRDVALKVLYPHYGDDEALLRRFQREAVTAAALEHPAIVPVYDVDEQDGMAYIAMKLLSGETLHDRLQAVGNLSPVELLRLLAPIASALDYAHARGVIHRDIKPGNIFLDATPDGERVMLTDFGIAKQLDTPGLTTTGALIGTPDYMAPEQIAGRAVDGRTDLYALGMLAYRALTGRRAFEGSTQDVLLGHLYNRPAAPSQLNPALPRAIDAVIDRATAPDPSDRFPTAGAFVAAMQAASAVPVAGTTVLAAGAATPTAHRGNLVAPATSGTATASTFGTIAAGRVETPQWGVAPGAGGASPKAADAAAKPAQANAAPWLAAILLALLAGGLAVALFFALSRANGAATAPTPLPPPLPSETLAPTAAPSETPTSAPSATATGEPSATAEPPTTTLEPTVAPPTAAPTASSTASATVTAPPAPTATLAPTATVTPAPTATETATATPTPPPVARCDDELLTGGFGKLFDEKIEVRTALGCPEQREIGGNGSQQFFERGAMFYWDRRNNTPNADFIYVLYGTDTGIYEELSPEEVSELGPDPTPGPDPNQPVRGFGRIYFNKPDVREELGAFTSPEIELRGRQQAVVQQFENGLMLHTPIYQPTNGKSIFVLYNDGRFDRFDDTFEG